VLASITATCHHSCAAAASFARSRAIPPPDWTHGHRRLRRPPTDPPERRSLSAPTSHPPDRFVSAHAQSVNISSQALAGPRRMAQGRLTYLLDHLVQLRHHAALGRTDLHGARICPASGDSHLRRAIPTCVGRFPLALGDSHLRWAIPTRAKAAVRCACPPCFRPDTEVRARACAVRAGWGALCRGGWLGAGWGAWVRGTDLSWIASSLVGRGSACEPRTCSTSLEYHLHHSHTTARQNCRAERNSGGPLDGRTRASRASRWLC
jgi:hypothetical protein